jgi:hypothetical protein
MSLDEQWWLTAPEDRHTAEPKLHPMPLQKYGVFAQHPEVDHIIAHVEVMAISVDEARAAARRELAKTGRDHFSLVVCQMIKDRR